MFHVRFLCLALVLACLVGISSSALAAEVDCDSTYCFTSQDFSLAEEPLTGICITEVPRQNGAVLLGSRVLQPGDILSAEQISMMTFRPLQAQEDAQAVISYLPIFSDRVEPPATMTLSIRGKADHAPIAQDSAMETYKNLPNDGQLKVSDPEGQPLTYALVRGPKRGEVTLQEDGRFTYTPKKNKVGVDSFTYTAADPAGNVSREATVTVQILKPTDACRYTDTMGLDCQFEAEWLRNTGLFVGECVSGQNCFLPEKEISRGDFLAMLVQMLDIPTDDQTVSAIPEETPQWLKPYLAAALRAGLMDQLDTVGAFDPALPITGAEAAVMVQNALDLPATQQLLDAQPTMTDDSTGSASGWAASALAILAENGIRLSPDSTLTRADAAQVLYQTSMLAVDAPGTTLFRMA